MSKKTIDIEKLLQWALREELPKGKAVSASAWDLIMNYGQLGARIQTSGYGHDGLGFVPGAPHEDALIVADEVGKLNDEARFADPEQVRPLFGSWVEIASDAIAAILKAQFSPRQLVIGRAILGTRPPWDFPHPTVIPEPKRYVRNERGELRDIALVYGIDAYGDTIEIVPKYYKTGKGAVYDLALAPHSPLHWGDPDLISIGHARAEYVAWHGALVTLARSLRGRLAEYEPAFPAVRPLPWITGQVAASRVLSDLMQPNVMPAKLPLAPKRPAPGRPVESQIEAKMRASKAASASERRRLAAASVLQNDGSARHAGLN